jgi:phosphoenolpyruvate-protein kinase (PTS system EI component)
LPLIGLKASETLQAARQKSEDEFSMSSLTMHVAKQILPRLDEEETNSVALAVLEQEDAEDVIALVRKTYPQLPL